mgnify:CR=1 FL=1
MVHVYGIPNCDTVKKATTWLKKRRIDFVFHDFKQETIPDQQLKSWCDALSWETVLNKKSSTWRALDPATQAGINNNRSARDHALSSSVGAGYNTGDGYQNSFATGIRHSF